MRSCCSFPVNPKVNKIARRLLHPLEAHDEGAGQLHGQLGAKNFPVSYQQLLLNRSQGLRRISISHRPLIKVLHKRYRLLVIHRPTGVEAGLCSTGQQKALLIGLILSNARALEADVNLRNPLVLLDEAVAHLEDTKDGKSQPEGGEHRAQRHLR